VDYVVTTATYDLEGAFTSGQWRVYEVTGPLVVHSRFGTDREAITEAGT
jgi:hypothetical protein